MNIESIPKFTEPAVKVWEKIPPQTRKLLLSNVWCGGCGEVVTIINFSSSIRSGDLLLEGSCSVCGCDVVRD